MGGLTLSRSYPDSDALRQTLNSAYIKALECVCVNCFRVCLFRYLDNILSHPGEEKYTKIPMNNKSFKEKVQSVQGATLFLEAVGFQQHLLPHKGQSGAEL